MDSKHPAAGPKGQNLSAQSNVLGKGCKNTAP
jgi:hypothetical protein